MKPLRYGALVLIGATLSFMGLEKDNPCLDNDIVPMIEKFEGWEDTPYKDIAGIDTTGYGFTKVFLKYWNLLFSDIDRDTGNAVVQEYCYIVNDKYFNKTNLNKIQRKAVFSFVYNVGEGAFANSTLNKLAIERPLTNNEVCHELKKYIYTTVYVKDKSGKMVKTKVPVKGLQNRRSNECSIMGN